MKGLAPLAVFFASRLFCLDAKINSAFSLNLTAGEVMLTSRDGRLDKAVILSMIMLGINNIE